MSKMSDRNAMTASCFVLFLATAAPANSAPVIWLPDANGSWHDAANWSTSPALPGVADDVTINTPSAITVTHNLGDNTVNRILSEEDFQLSGGSLALVSDSTFNALLRITAGSLTTDTNVSASDGEWRGGEFNGGGTTTFTGTLMIKAGGMRTLNGGHTLMLNGTTTWTTDGVSNSTFVNLEQSAKVVNSGTFNDQLIVDSSIGNTDASDVLFHNTGTYTKTGARATRIEPRFVSSGSLDIQAGFFTLENGGEIGGTFSVAEGANLELRGGVFDVSGTGSGPGTLYVHNATATLGAAFTQTGTLRLSSGGSVIADHDNTIGSVRMNGGTRAGAGTLTAATGQWVAGTFTGAGTTAISGDFSMETNSEKIITDGHTVQLDGDTSWTGQGMIAPQIKMSGNAQIVNNGTFTDTNFQSQILTEDASDLRFINNGTYVKTGSNTSLIQAHFENNGTLDIQSGTLDAAGLNNVGTVLVNAAWVGAELVNRATLGGGGHIGGRLTGIGGVFRPGNSPGTLTVSGEFSMDAASSLEIEIAAVDDYDKLVVNNSATLNGTLFLVAFDDYTPTDGDNITLLESTGLAGSMFTTIELIGFAADVGVALVYLNDEDVVAQFSVAAVPVPAGVWFLLSAFGALGAIPRSRQYA